MCRALQLSYSGYWAWRKREARRQARARRQLTLIGQVRKIHASSGGTYGSPRVCKKLQADGVQCSENTVARLMQQNGIKGRCKQRFTVTTQSQHDFPIASNVLQRRFAVEDVEGPDRFWVSDISYISVQGRWLYLAVVLDLFSRRVVGWHLSDSLAQELPLEALKMALRLRQPEEGLIHHSDRGVQYTATAYRELLQVSGAIVSMSEKGNCWDNAVAESFFSTLKKELIYNKIGGRQYANQAEAYTDLKNYIENWYNRERLHSTLGYLSPLQFEMRYQAKKSLN